MNFGEILSKSWQIIWKHKVLWIFGILASCSSANSYSPNSRYTFGGEDLPPQWQWSPEQWNIPDWQVAVIIGAILLFALVLIILAIFFGTMGRVGLIRGAQKAEKGVEALSLGELFSGSLPYFWRVFLLNLIVGLAIALAVIVLLFIGIFGTVLTFGLGALCLIPLICLLGPLFWFVGIVLQQADAAIVIENLGITDGLQRGWGVVRANLGNVFVMGLILTIGIGLIGGFIIGAPVIFIVLPAAIGAIAGTKSALGGGLLVAGLCLLAYLPVAIVLNGVLTSYIQTAWALTFLRLTGRPAEVEPAPELAPEATA